MSQLQLVTESEIRKGSMIGSGAFGTVYRVNKFKKHLMMWPVFASNSSNNVFASKIVLYSCNKLFQCANAGLLGANGKERENPGSYKSAAGGCGGESD